MEIGLGIGLPGRAKAQIRCASELVHSTAFLPQSFQLEGGDVARVCVNAQGYDRRARDLRESRRACLASHASTERNELTFGKDQNGFTAFEQFAGLFKCQARIFSGHWDLPCSSENVPKDGYLKQITLCNEARHFGKDQWQKDRIRDVGVIDGDDLCAGWQRFQAFHFVFEAEDSPIDLRN